MREFNLKQYIEMLGRFNKMSFFDKINTIKDNSDILTLAFDGNWWNVQTKSKEIQEQLEDLNREFEIENEWGSSEMYDLINLLEIDNTGL